MKHFVLVMLIFLVAFEFGDAAAYDTQTHALMTREAYKRSVLAKTGDDSIDTRLGFDRLMIDDIFTAYWNTANSSGALYYRFGTNTPTFGYGVGAPADFERCQMQRFLGLGATRQYFRTLFTDTVEFSNRPAMLPIQNWMVRGAIREDDMGDGPGVPALWGAYCLWDWYKTIDDQPGKITRSFRHFFDPILDEGLTVAGVHYPKSVDWALGYHGTTPAQGWSRSTYSYLDARDAYWRALTRSWNKEHGAPVSDTGM